MLSHLPFYNDVVNHNKWELYMEDLIIYLTNKMTAKEIIIITLIAVFWLTVKGILAYKNNKLNAHEKEIKDMRLSSTEQHRDELISKIDDIRQQLNILTNRYNDHVSHTQAIDIVNTHLLLSKHSFICLITESLDSKLESVKLKERILQTIDVRKNNDDNALELYKYKGLLLSDIFDTIVYDEIINLSINCVIKKEITLDQYKETLKLICKQSMNDFADKLNKI